MADHYDGLEIRDPAEREAALFSALPDVIAAAKDGSPAWAKRLAAVDPKAITTRAALATLPVLRKSDVMEAQQADPPFAGFLAVPQADLARVYVSPGPVYVAQGREADPFLTARALFAAGVRAGALVLNTFSYHMTPGAFILESGLGALGAPVFAAGPVEMDKLLPLVSDLSPSVYVGVPDALNILLDKAEEAGRDVSCLTKALVSGAALPGDLRARIEARGVSVLQCYATADIGVIAYESGARDGLILNEDMIVEIVRPGTGDPVPEGEVGEIVVTKLSGALPLIRFATGDLTAVLPGTSPCGRTNTRIKGWMGRADQRTKVKGLFVDPAQIAKVVAAHPSISKARLVVSRADHTDNMVLRVEGLDAQSAGAVAATLKTITGLSGAVEAVSEGSLPNDGKVIEDARPIDG